MNRLEIEKNEKSILKPYACFSSDFQRFDTAKHPLRTEFQRDRDRILHSKAFRRLEYKTQVFLTSKSDHLRTRLTHSLEVSQIARTIGQLLGVNTDLIEAISLGHDLGHSPFGHAGERKIQEILKKNNILYFKHNVQSIKIVELLENKYDYEGLRLTLPTKEGIIKHTSLPKVLPDYCKDLFIDKEHSVTIEGQIVAIADELAQITHDLNDYIEYKIIEIKDFINHALFNEINEFYKTERAQEYAEEKEEITFKFFESYQNPTSSNIHILLSCLTDFLVSKLVEHSSENLKKCNEKALELSKVYINYNEPLRSIIEDFHSLLNKKILSDYRINKMDERGKWIISELFDYYQKYPHQLHEVTKEKYEKEGIIVIADYIAGMTDRYIMERFERILDLKD